jgi:hypothetical protein
MKITTQLLFALLTIVTTSFHAIAQTVDLDAIHDSWVSEDDPDANFDTETDMQVAQMDTDTMKSREAFVKFNLNSIDGYVEFATIGFTSAQKGADEGWIEKEDFIVQIYGAGNEWNESEVTWNTKPEIFSPLLAEVNINEFNTYEVSNEGIRNYVNQAISNGDTLISFVFRGKELTNGSRLWISDKGWKAVTLSLNSFKTAEIRIIEDSWVSEDEPDTNFNGETDLQVAVMDTDSMKSRQAYLKFNIEGLKQSDKFVLRFASAQKPIWEGWNELDKLNVGLFTTENDWSETDITWSSKPVAGELIAECLIYGFTGHNYYFFDSNQLTDYVNQAIDEGKAQISFTVKGTELSNGSRIWISDKGWEPVKLIYKKQLPAVIQVEGLTIDQTHLDLKLNEIVTLLVSIQPENATNPGLSWSSDDPSVATVNEGEVTATGTGSTQIRATSLDGGFEAVCVVTVTDPTSIQNNQVETLTIFPNPANDHLTIQFYGEEFNELIVTDIMGKISLKLRSVFRNEYSLNTARLKQGMYIISMKDDSRIVTSYFIVN